MNVDGSLRLAQVAFYTALHSLKFTQNVSLNSQTASQNFQLWAQSLCRILEIRIHVSGEPILKDAGIIIGNHMSYLDIPVLCAHEPINFVAKSEMMKWPIVGRVGKAIGTIFHDRKNPASKKDTAQIIKHAVLNEHKRVCVYPEGTTSLRGRPWKPGVFKLAHELQCPVQNYNICYRPADIIAFQTKNMFDHALKLNSKGPIDVYLHFGPVIKISDPETDFKYWVAWNKKILANELTKQSI